MPVLAASLATAGIAGLLYLIAAHVQSDGYRSAVKGEAAYPALPGEDAARPTITRDLR